MTCQPVGGRRTRETGSRHIFPTKNPFRAICPVSAIGMALEIRFPISPGDWL